MSYRRWSRPGCRSGARSSWASLLLGPPIPLRTSAPEGTLSIYADTDQLYAVIQALFARIEQADPRAGDAILASHLVMRLCSTAPDAQITINGRRRPLKVTYGPDSVHPTLDIELPADLLHRILSGEMSMKKALANGEVKVRGPVWKATALEDLFCQSQSLYPEILREQNLLPGD